MLGRLRRWRWLAGLLVVLSPPVAGTVIPLIDPCPIDTPWLLAENTGDQHGHDAHAGHGEPSESDDSHAGHTNCHCIGACTGAATVGLRPAAGSTLALVPAVALAPRVPADAPVLVTRPRFLLPPSHAPPVG